MLFSIVSVTDTVSMPSYIDRIVMPILVFFLQVGAPARVGLVAPVDVVVPPGNTGLDPSQTSFFQVSLEAIHLCYS